MPADDFCTPQFPVVVGGSDPGLRNQCFTSAPESFDDPTGSRFHGQPQSPKEVKPTQGRLVHLQALLWSVLLLLVLDAGEGAIVAVARHLQHPRVVTKRCPVRFALLDHLLKCRPRAVGVEESFDLAAPAQLPRRGLHQYLARHRAWVPAARVQSDAPTKCAQQSISAGRSFAPVQAPCPRSSHGSLLNAKMVHPSNTGDKGSPLFGMLLLFDLKTLEELGLQ